MVESNVLILGNGGRESALALNIIQLERFSYLSDHSFVQVNKSAETGLEYFDGSKPLVIVGPEAMLADGVADTLRSQGYSVLGASKEVAKYEASKAEAVWLFREHDITHPETFIANGPHMGEHAYEYVCETDPKTYVIKGDGLASGKAVVLPKTKQQALETIGIMLNGGYDGSGKDAILFAERKKGPELSLMAIVGEGKDDFLCLPPARDYKRLKNGNNGPNTGGMGSVAPVELTDKQLALLHKKMYDVLDSMEKSGTPAKSCVIYLGLMESEDLEGEDFDILEINVRFGDPEIIPILSIMTKLGVDTYELFLSAAEGKLKRPDVDLSNIGMVAVTTCIAAAGYPGTPRTGDIIYGIDREYKNVDYCLAGVEMMSEGQYVTAGGRVLYVTGIGENLRKARRAMNKAIGKQAIHFTQQQYRTDIGLASNIA